MKKEAYGPILDLIAGGITGPILTRGVKIIDPESASLSALVTPLVLLSAGLFSSIKDPKKHRQELAKRKILPFLPFYDALSLGERLKTTAVESKKINPRAKPYLNIVSELVTPITSAALATTVAIALSSKLGPTNAFRAGVAVGGLPFVAAAVAALIKKRRTAEEQAKKETIGRAIAKVLIPGLGDYDFFKRYGRSFDY